MTSNVGPIICVSSTNKRTTQVRWAIVVGGKHEGELEQTILLMGLLVVYLISMKWLWNLHVGKLGKNIMGMSMHIIIEQMEKIDLENQAKIIILEKWLIATPN